MIDRGSASVISVIVATGFSASCPATQRRANVAVQSYRRLREAGEGAGDELFLEVV